MTRPAATNERIVKVVVGISPESIAGCDIQIGDVELKPERGFLIESIGEKAKFLGAFFGGFVADHPVSDHRYSGHSERIMYRPYFRHPAHLL